MRNSQTEDLVELDDDTHCQRTTSPTPQKTIFRKTRTWTESDYDESAKNLFGITNISAITQATNLRLKAIRVRDPGFMAA